jgi:hypothetical protein
MQCGRNLLDELQSASKRLPVPPTNIGKAIASNFCNPTDWHATPASRLVKLSPHIVP